MSSRRFSYQGFLTGLALGALVAGLVVSTHLNRQMTAQLEAQKATLQNDFLKTTASLQVQMEACAKDRQAHLADRLALTESLSACQKKQVMAVPPAAPVVPAAPVAMQPVPASPQAPQKQVKVLQPRPRPAVVGKKAALTPPAPAAVPLAPATPPASALPSAPVPTAQSLPSGPVAAKGQTVILSVGQEQRLGASGVLSLEAVSRLQTGKFCVIAGPDHQAIRIASGTGKVVMLGGVRYTLVATVRDGQSCKFSIQ